MLVALLSMFVAANVETRSHWDSSHRLIVTERRWVENGTERHELVLGGTVDGVTMAQVPLLREAGGLVRAYVPTTTRHGTQVHWKKSCVFIRPGTPTPSDLQSDDAPVLQAAMNGWMAPTRGCGFLQLKLSPREAGEVGLDYVNRVIYREQSWCVPAHDGLPELCHQAGAIGLTTLFYRDIPGDPDDGEIFDADVELNEVNYALGVCEADGGCASNGMGTLADLQNTFTHELGHLIGLDHTCNDGMAVVLDGQGQPVPSCMPVSALPMVITGATMFPFSEPAEISKRVLSADDVDGFCARYPLAGDPHDCTPVTAPADAGVPDAGAPDGGVMMTPPAHGCGCGALDGAALSALLLLAGSFRSRARRSVA